VALGAALVDPRQESFLVLLRQPAVILELTVLGFGQPRRHAVLGDHFLDGGGPRLDVVVVHERHRPDLAGTMAFLAVLLQDARYFLGVGALAGGLWLGGPGDDAAGDGRRRRAHVLAGEHLVDGLGQVAAAWFRAVVANAILIVDPALVTDLA